MKSIILVRHGKSSWEYDVSDRERPLKSRGVNDANLISNYFLRTNNPPEKIFSSPAKRALSTCNIFAKVFNLSENSIIIVEDLYDFGGHNVIKFIKSLPNSISEIMIFGHNHAFTSIVNLYGSKTIDNLPTSGLVKLSFQISEWKNIKPGKTELILIPKQLKND